MNTKNIIIILASILAIILLVIGVNIFVLNRLGNENTNNSNAYENTQIGDTQYINESDNTNVDTEAPTVYMTTDISSTGLIEVYNALNWQPTRKSSC